MSALLKRLVKSYWLGRFVMIKVESHDSDLRRKGRVLAIILLGLLAAGFMLAIYNIVLGETQYNVENGLFISLLLGLYILNRFGFVRTASLFIVVLMAMSAFLMVDENLTTMYLAMPLPILVASYLLASWSGFVVATLMIIYALVLGIASPSLLILVIITIVSYLFADSLDCAYRESRHKALHDSLTGLPNRTLFLDRLQQAIDRSDRDRNLRAVLFMDLDHFKIVNDSLSHELGDKLLITVARRLQACLRPGDTAARLGGDEFVALLDGISDVGDAVHVAQRIAKALEAPIELEERQVSVSTSVGISLNEDVDEKSEILLRNADVAMYEAKKEGKARYKVFDPDMHAQMLRRLDMENDLRQAIEREELRIYYQPKVILSTGRIIGMEALVRWEHPERGLVHPGEFIPLAEETGLILPLGRWVLRETCRQAREWQKHYPTVSPQVTSVNLSVKQFQGPNLVQELVEILRETGLNPGCLQLEITESVVTDNVEHAVGLLQELRELGVQLALDDFGTGYSSLISLRRFPLDDLKIDQAFVDGLGRNTEDTAIVQLVIDLAHAVGMRALAEGVKTIEQVRQLQNMGCDQAQGYYFWEPLAGKSAAALLADSPRWPLDHHLTEHSLNPGMFLEGRRYFDPKR